MYVRFIYLLYHIMIVPYNTLLYLALSRWVLCIGATLKQTWNKVSKKEQILSASYEDDITSKMELNEAVIGAYLYIYYC